MVVLRSCGGEWSGRFEELWGGVEWSFWGVVGGSGVVVLRSCGGSGAVLVRSCGETAIMHLSVSCVTVAFERLTNESSVELVP